MSDFYKRIIKARQKILASDLKKDKKVTVITKDGRKFNYEYLSLDKLLGVVIPTLLENNLFLFQNIFKKDDDQFLWLKSTLYGELQDAQDCLASETMICQSEYIANHRIKGEYDPRVFGKCITYARRYGICNLLCIIADSDTDGMPDYMDYNIHAYAPKQAKPIIEQNPLDNLDNLVKLGQYAKIITLVIHLLTTKTHLDDGRIKDALTLAIEACINKNDRDSIRAIIPAAIEFQLLTADADIVEKARDAFFKK